MKLVQEKGIMSTPNPRLGKVLPKTTADLIKAFYYSDEVSRIMPGKKDYVSVNLHGERQHLQKRLILCNLKEAFKEFKDQNPDIKIGYYIAKLLQSCNVHKIMPQYFKQLTI